MSGFTTFSQKDYELMQRLVSELGRLNEERIPDVLLSCKEAARYLGVSQQTISTYLRQGRITKRTAGDVTGIPLRQLTGMRKRNRREAGEPQSS